MSSTRSVDTQCVYEVRVAAKECLDRGLVVAARWYVFTIPVAEFELKCWVGALNSCYPFRLQRGREALCRRDHFELTQYLPLSQLLLQQDLYRLNLLVSPHLQANLQLLLRSSPNLLQLLHLLFRTHTLLFLLGTTCVPQNQSWKLKKMIHSKQLGHVSKHANSFMPSIY